MHFLLDRRTRVRQYAYPRRNSALNSGVVVVHTAENVTDWVGVDPGAENVAAWMADRPDQGSYHRLCDADSTVPLLPWGYEAWGDTRTNNHAVHISAAVRCADWHALGARGDVIALRMADAAREYAAWLHDRRGIVLPARRITRAQALARVPGFIGHGEIDTGRRTDPGTSFNWSVFFDAFANGATPPSPAPPLPPVPVEVDFAMDRLDLRNAHVVPVTGRHVDNLQGLLLAARYGPKGLVGPDGRPDGIAGVSTQRYVADWQRRTNTGDGQGNADLVVGPGTWKTLIEY